MGFLAGTTGLEDADVDADARRLTTSFPLAVGGERQFVVRVLAPRDSGGDTLTLALRLQHFDSQTEY